MASEQSSQLHNFFFLFDSDTVVTPATFDHAISTFVAPVLKVGRESAVQ